MAWQTPPILIRQDGSYLISFNGYPCHVPNSGEWAELWAEVHAWAELHPEQVEAEPVPPDPTAEERDALNAAAVRADRDRRIAATDYLLMPDYPLEGDARDYVRAYRQALRDMPEQPGFPWNGVEDAPWPELPAYLTL